MSELQIFKKGKTVVSKYDHLILPGAFPDKFTPAIDFADKAVVQCDAPLAKLLFWMLVIYK